MVNIQATTARACHSSSATLTRWWVKIRGKHNVILLCQWSMISLKVWDFETYTSRLKRQWAIYHQSSRSWTLSNCATSRKVSVPLQIASDPDSYRLHARSVVWKWRKTSWGSSPSDKRKKIYQPNWRSVKKVTCSQAINTAGLTCVRTYALATAAWYALTRWVSLDAEHSGDARCLARPWQPFWVLERWYQW